MNLQKKDQTGRYGKKAKRRRKNPVVTVKESGLQKQIEDTLKAYHIKYVHIENSFWSWFNYGYTPETAGQKKNVPEHIYYPFIETFAGMPDIVSWIPIGDTFNLSYTPELKTLSGVLSEKQKKWGKEINVPVLRTTGENVKGIVEFVSIAEEIIEREHNKEN
jgi:hypothetical protein